MNKIRIVVEKRGWLALSFWDIFLVKIPTQRPASYPPVKEQILGSYIILPGEKGTREKGL